MHAKDHWEKVYNTKAATEVSWFQPHAELSLKLIRNTGVAKTAAIVDVGGGASTLVDDLLNEGFNKLTVLDLSAAALTTAQTRLAEKAATVNWRAANILQADFANHSIDVWHDRAVFHFLTSEAERQQYVHKVMQAAFIADATVPTKNQ